mmetsp:Transcript_15170/g.28786  ORF Transcript_15170/g.28786 Transcript_15170/m.28786 type:complete len:297 (-) Transcript_15170:41-931(-)|eukprot:scaffold16119_cov162-Amphora_coffeaeformis.AAC.3
MALEGCCPVGAFGAMGTSVSRGPLRGKVVPLQAITKEESSKRSEMPCYQVGASSEPKSLVLVFSDVHGVDTGNHKVFCDSLQEKLGADTAVWMPDLFRGCPMAPNVGTKTFWVDLLCRLSIVWAEKTRITAPAVKADLKEIIQPNVPPSVDKIGMVGFCFGAWVIGRSFGWSNHEDHDGQRILPNLSAGVLIHPSWRPEGVVVGGGKTKEEIAEGCKTKPILLMPGKQDVDFHKNSPIAQQLADQSNLSIDDVVVDFTHMDHGWVSRADSTNHKAIQEAQEQATQNTANFFKQHIM